jgi:hypothetical protein
VPAFEPRALFGRQLQPVGAEHVLELLERARPDDRRGAPLRQRLRVGREFGIPDDLAVSRAGGTAALARRGHVRSSSSLKAVSTVENRFRYVIAAVS